MQLCAKPDRTEPPSPNTQGWLQGRYDVSSPALPATMPRRLSPGSGSPPHHGNHAASTVPGRGLGAHRPRWHGSSWRTSRVRL